MNKPVAWRVQNPQMFNDWITFPTKEQADLYAFHNGKGNLPEPLYIHPVELTDEEILQVMINVYSDTVPPIRGVEFARAILRRAQEK